MKHLQRLIQAAIFGVCLGGAWAFSEYVLGLQPPPAWYAAGIAAGVGYWICLYDHS